MWAIDDQIIAVAIGSVFRYFPMQWMVEIALLTFLPSNVDIQAILDYMCCIVVEQASRDCNYALWLSICVKMCTTGYGLYKWCLAIYNGQCWANAFVITANHIND